MLVYVHESIYVWDGSRHGGKVYYMSVIKWDRNPAQQIDQLYETGELKPRYMWCENNDLSHFASPLF